VKGGSVEIHFAKMSSSEKSKLFLKYDNDLIPNPCPRRMGCMPSMIARHEYIDIIAIGKFTVTNDQWRGFNCILEVEDILSMNLGPPIDTKSLMEERQSIVNARHITTKALLENATTRVEPSIPSEFGTIDAKISVTVIVDLKGSVIYAGVYANSNEKPNEKPNRALQRICEEAAGKWQFKPFIKKPFLRKERAISVIGEIVFDLIN